MGRQCGLEITHSVQCPADLAVCKGKVALPARILRLPLNQFFLDGKGGTKRFNSPFQVPLSVKDRPDIAVGVRQFELPVQVGRIFRDELLGYVLVHQPLIERPIQIPLPAHHVSNPEMSCSQTHLPFAVIGIAFGQLPRKRQGLLECYFCGLQVPLAYPDIADLGQRLRATEQLVVIDLIGG